MPPRSFPERRPPLPGTSQARAVWEVSNRGESGERRAHVPEAIAAGAAYPPPSRASHSHRRAKSSQSWPMGVGMQYGGWDAGLYLRLPPPPCPPSPLSRPEIWPLNVRRKLYVRRRRVTRVSVGRQRAPVRWVEASKCPLHEGDTSRNHSDSVQAAKSLNFTRARGNQAAKPTIVILRRLLMTIKISNVFMHKNVYPCPRNTVTLRRMRLHPG